MEDSSGLERSLRGHSCYLWTEQPTERAGILTSISTCGPGAAMNRDPTAPNTRGQQSNFALRHGPNSARSNHIFVVLVARSSARSTIYTPVYIHLPEGYTRPGLSNTGAGGARTCVRSFLE